MEGAGEAIADDEAAVVAGAVAAEGAPAPADQRLQDDHHLVVIGAGDLAFEVGEVLVVDDPAGGP